MMYWNEFEEVFDLGKNVGGEYGYGGNDYGNGSGFALLVVLFILLIIVGAYFWNGGYGGY